MNITAAPSVAPDRTSIKAPSLAAIERYADDLTALGAASVTADGPFAVRATFNSVPAGVVAANLVNDTLYGAKLLVDMPLTGIPYVMSNVDVVAALRNLPGVQAVFDGTPSDQATFGVMARTKEDAAALDQLLRDSVLLTTRGGYVPHAINITYGPVVEFGADA